MEKSKSNKFDIYIPSYMRTFYLVAILKMAAMSEYGKIWSVPNIQNRLFVYRKYVLRVLLAIMKYTSRSFHLSSGLGRLI